MMHLGVITLFPELFSSLSLGVVGRAFDNELAKLQLWNPRDFTQDLHRQVDDKPYGGGPGMVMMYEPVHAAITEAKKNMPMPVRTIYLSPQGRQIKQADLNQLVQDKQSLLFIAGRYEGMDQRLLDSAVDEEWSLGDFVMSGGELAAMVFIDAMVRLIPGSLGHAQSAAQDSFMNGLLDCPHYTRPAEIYGLHVPDVLLQGNHQAINHWRRKQALGQTWLKRPDLLKQVELSDTDKQLLAEFQCEQRQTR